MVSPELPDKRLTQPTELHGKIQAHLRHKMGRVRLLVEPPNTQLTQTR